MYAHIGMFMTLVSVRPTHQNGACTSRLDLPDTLYVQALSLVVRDEADADLKRFCQSSIDSAGGGDKHSICALQMGWLWMAIGMFVVRRTP